jgi:predicted permease
MNISHDLRFAVRMIWKDRLVTTVAVATLALGIGANSTVFTCMNAILLGSLPYPAGGRIFYVNSRALSKGESGDVSYPDFVDMRAQARTFESLAAYRNGSMNIADADHAAERLIGAWMTANAFDTLGQAPLIGRGFFPEDDKPGAAPVVILGYGVWKDRYNGSRAILGQTVKVNEVPATVVGVMPEGVKFPMTADIWQPLALNVERDKRAARGLAVFGRARTGVSPSDAQAEFATIAGRLAKQYADTNKDVGVEVMRYNERFNGGPFKVIFGGMMAAVAFVLLIACANVANLMLARSGRRAREIAVRVSVGATRWQIVRQLLVESLAISTLAGLLGFGLSLAGVHAFDVATTDLGRPYWIQFGVDYRVVAFLAFVCLSAAVLSGLAPALHVARSDVHATLKEGGRGGTGSQRTRRFTTALVVAELALTVVLLAGTALVLRSFLAIKQMDFGIPMDRVLTMRLTLAEKKYPKPEDRIAFYERLSDEMASLPGVVSASFASSLPLNGGEAARLQVEGRPWPDGKAPRVTLLYVGPGYFDALGITLTKGRRFTRDDGRPGNEVAIVNQEWAQRFAAGGEPTARRIRVEREGAQASGWLTVVGVAPVIRQNNPQEDARPDPVVYVPLRQDPGRYAVLMARGPGDGTLLARPVREALRKVDTDQPVFRVMTLARVIQRLAWPYSVFGTLLAVFAGIALLISSVGVYAMTAYSVAQRRDEIGVRMALGAQSRQISWLVLRRAAWQLAIGLTIGLAAAVGVGRLMRAILIQEITDTPITYAAVVVLFILVTLTACLVPSRRAARLDPVVVLRSE